MSKKSLRFGFLVAIAVSALQVCSAHTMPHQDHSMSAPSVAHATAEH